MANSVDSWFVRLLLFGHTFIRMIKNWLDDKLYVFQNWNRTLENTRHTHTHTTVSILLSCLMLVAGCWLLVTNRIFTTIIFRGASQCINLQLLKEWICELCPSLVNWWSATKSTAPPFPQNKQLLEKIERKIVSWAGAYIWIFNAFNIISKTPCYNLQTA